MKQIILAALPLLLLLLVCSPCRSHADEKPAPLRREFKLLPIAAGEKLEYEIRYARFPLYASIGTLTFEYLGAETMTEAVGQVAGFKEASGAGNAAESKPDERVFHFRASAISKGILLAILGVDVNDRLETLVSAHDFSARLGFKQIKEGKKRATQVTLFNSPQQSVTTTWQDLNAPTAQPRVKTALQAEGLLDLLSAIYFVRLQKLKPGQPVVFTINDDGANYPFEVAVGQHEKINSDCGKVKTIRLEPKIFGAGRVISRPGEMTLWVTDDARHIPLRATAKTAAATLTVKLLNYKNTCKLLDPPEEATPKPAKQNENAKNAK